MTRAPVEAGLRYNDPGTLITAPAWLQWFQAWWDGEQGLYSGTMVTAALTPTGHTGSVTFVNGRVTAVTPAT